MKHLVSATLAVLPSLTLRRTMKHLSSCQDKINKTVVTIALFSLSLALNWNNFAQASPSNEADRDQCRRLSQISPPTKDDSDLFLRCAGQAELGNDPQSAAQAYAMAGALLIRQGRTQEAQDALGKAAGNARLCPDPKTQARLLIETGLAYGQIAPDAGISPLVLTAVTLFQEASLLAESSADPRLLSAALGYMAEIYEGGQRLAEALQLSRRAVFAAQEAQDSRLLYQWHWQAGRLLARQQDSDGAIAAYRLAIAKSRAIRDSSGGRCQDTGGVFSSPRPVTALYEETVDLLLKKADAPQQQHDLRTACLREAKETIELLKASELRDYFQDNCLATLQSKKIDIDAISPRTAIIYPIILADRIEMLATIGGAITSYQLTMPIPKMVAEVTMFRALLETRTSSEYLPLSQHLYDVLVRPMEADLSAAGVDTLVFVPAGVLRTMPFDALHDGKGFLVDRYATAITPGLDLTDPQPINQKAVKALAAGLTKPVQGFAALPYVDKELQNFHKFFGGHELLNEAFSVGALGKTLREEPVGIIHIASHGQFGHDLAHTFLLAYDQKLTMDHLNEYVGMFRFRKEPLELLTLSACQTAAGDDQAALGLAGVAVRAGARSALATLWCINDQASSILVDTFYHKLPPRSWVERATAATLSSIRSTSSWTTAGLWPRLRRATAAISRLRPAHSFRIR